MQQLFRLARLPIYLWIVGIYPILHLYVANFGLVQDNQVAHIIAAMLIATTFGYWLAKRFTRDPHKAACFLAIASLYFSTNGHLYSLFVMPNSLLVWNIASAIVVIAIAFACLRLIPRRAYARFTPPFNLIAAALLAMQLVSLLSAHLSARQFADANLVYSQAWQDQPATEKALDSPELPDIYYIIPDGYPSDAQLLSEIGYDNSAFSEALQERGFVIAPHAQSNYGTTLNSLAATLNMRYYASNPTALADLDYMQIEIASNLVTRLLLEQGYTYLQLMSGFLLPSPLADENIEFGANGAITVNLDEGQLSPQRALWGHENEPQALDLLKVDDENLQMPFAPFYFETTLLRIAQPLLEDLRVSSGSTPLGLYSPRRFLGTLEELERITRRPEATFTIAHLMKPHGPLTFDANGNSVEPTWFPSEQAYKAELDFVNQMYLKTLDAILTASDGQALIIFQSDHGTYLGRTNDTSEEFRVFDIYAAYHLPGGTDLKLPQPYTTINSFAILLNEVFGIGLDLQDNRLLAIPQRYDALFEQVDVTEEFLHE